MSSEFHSYRLKMGENNHSVCYYVCTIRVLHTCSHKKILVNIPALLPTPTTETTFEWLHTLLLLASLVPSVPRPPSCGPNIFAEPRTGVGILYQISVYHLNPRCSWMCWHNVEEVLMFSDFPLSQSLSFGLLTVVGPQTLKNMYVW